ncbi:MAG: dihydrofolate reductase [Pseudomonadota bacterium]
MIIPNLSVIAAVADNRVIGVQNRLPWHLPADLRRFKRLTMGKPMLMGRNTWESLPGLLPGREHVVITRNPAYAATGACIQLDLAAAIAAYQHVPEIMLIGGAELYAQALPQAARLYLTYVHLSPEGDRWFPVFNPAEWEETEHARCDDMQTIPHTFVTLHRKHQ